MLVPSVLAEARATIPALRSVLTLPRRHQLAQAQALRRTFQALPHVESWNVVFGDGSLFDAWTRTPIMRTLYQANGAALRPIVDAAGWTIVEVGGGDGRLWREILRPEHRGRIVLVDPLPEPHACVAQALPPGVELVSMQCPVEHALSDLPLEVDAVVCSLTLHHVAGRDATQRAAFGLSGAGKREILAALHDGLRPGGQLVLNEADVHCDLEVPARDVLLRERIFDSYVRRCAAAMCDAIDAAPDDDLTARWWAIVRRWCLDQIDHADVEPTARDIFELDVERWMALLHEAGFVEVHRQPTDSWMLFWQYVATR